MTSAARQRRAAAKDADQNIGAMIADIRVLMSTQSLIMQGLAQLQSDADVLSSKLAEVHEIVTRQPVSGGPP